MTRIDGALSRTIDMLDIVRRSILDRGGAFPGELLERPSQFKSLRMQRMSEIDQVFMNGRVTGLEEGIRNMAEFSGIPKPLYLKKIEIEEIRLVLLERSDND